MHSEQVTEYVAKDGTRFKRQDRCEEHEAELMLVEPILATIPKAELKHGTYIQRDREVVLQAKRDLFALVLEKHGERYPKWLKWDADDVHPHSIIGRVLDDYDGPLSGAWRRIGVFNFDLGREYDQPYFASHPDEATEA